MNELKTDFTPLADEANDSAYPDFVRAMEGRQYGGEALEDAWCWFRFGWHAGMEHAARVADMYAIENYYRAAGDGAEAVAGNIRAKRLVSL